MIGPGSEFVKEQTCENWSGVGWDKNTLDPRKPQHLRGASVGLQTRS